MKLQTSISPRRDGTLSVTGLDGQKYAFTKGEDGELVGDVADEPTVAHLLSGGMFFPADPADFDVALGLTKVDDDGDDENDQGPTGGQGQSTGNDDDDDDDDEGSGEQSNALPLEANTPPKKTPKKTLKATKVGKK